MDGHHPRRTEAPAAQSYAAVAHKVIIRPVGALFTTIRTAKQSSGTADVGRPSLWFMVVGLAPSLPEPSRSQPSPPRATRPTSEWHAGRPVRRPVCSTPPRPRHQSTVHSHSPHEA